MKIRNAPKTYITQWKVASSAAPIAMNSAARDQRADDAPEQHPVLELRRHGEVREATRKTKRLSTDSAFSISHAWKNSSARSEPNRK